MTMSTLLKKLFDYFKDNGRYVQKCTDNNHFGKIKTPTLSRRAISIDAPCQCGFYKSHKDFMDKQHEKLNEVLKEIQNKK